MKLFGTSSVWNRHSSLAFHEMDERQFAFRIGIWMTVGVVSSAAAIAIGTRQNFSPAAMSLFFFLSLVGTIMAMNSEHRVIVLASYLMMAIPFGLTTAPLITKYTGIDLGRVFMVASAMLVVLTLVGALRPCRLEHWSVYPLGWGTAVLMGVVAIPYIFKSAWGAETTPTARDWLAVGLLSTYLLYDLRRAMLVERTAVNALACAVGVYLDVAVVVLSAAACLIQLAQRRLVSVRART